MFVSESDENGQSVKTLRKSLSDACEVNSPASKFSMNERPPPSTGMIACQSGSSDGMHVGCRQKPATGTPTASPHISATPVSVKELMIKSTFCAFSVPWIFTSCVRKIGADAKKFDSEAAIMSSCSSSAFEFMISWLTHCSVCCVVSPPLTQNRTCDRRRSNSASSARRRALRGQSRSRGRVRLVRVWGWGEWGWGRGGGVGQGRAGCTPLHLCCHCIC